MSLDIETDSNEADASRLDEMGVLEFLDFVTASDNLVGDVDARTLDEWSQEIKIGYQADSESMSEWLAIAERGIEATKQSKQEKNYPFEGASNVKYPIIVSAALQYNARAYPAIVPDGNPIKCKVNGNDPDGRKAAKAERVAAYGSYQLKTENVEWEEDTDKLTFIGPTVGSMLRKYWYDPATERQRSRLCDPLSFRLDNSISTLDDAPRITEEFGLWPHEVAARRNTGVFADIELSDEDNDGKRIEFLEQHCRFDLDGDGYPEPYVVTIHKEDDAIVRIVAAFDLDNVRISQGDQPKILSIEANTFFTHYRFLPSPDGTFLGIGFGGLLGNPSEVANTMLNMIIDGAHYASMPSGFIGAKDFQIRGGAQRFGPGEWKPQPFRGDDIRKSLVEISTPQPSPILFQVLGMMVDISKEISSTSSILTGQAGNAGMPVGTVMALIEQGMQMFTASYKRIYCSLKREFELLSRLNVKYLSAEKYNAFFDDVDANGQPIVYDPAEDFDLSGMDISPVADPKSVTDVQRMASAQFLLDLAKQGFIDKGAAIERVLGAAGIPNKDELIPRPDKTAAMVQEMQMQSAKLGLMLQAAEIDYKHAQALKQTAGAGKDIADAEAKEVGSQIDQYLQDLMNMKGELDAFNRRGLGVMAGGPGNGANPMAPQTAIAGDQGGPAGVGMGDGGMGLRKGQFMQNG